MVTGGICVPGPHHTILSYQAGLHLLPSTLRALTRVMLLGVPKNVQGDGADHAAPSASYLELCCQGVAGPLQGGGVKAFLVAL